MIDPEREQAILDRVKRIPIVDTPALHIGEGGIQRPAAFKGQS